MIKRIMQSEASGGVVLIVASIMALCMANSSFLAQAYHTFIHYALTHLPIGGHAPQSVLFWVNDGLMAIFFLAVGMEVKFELVKGALSSRQKALFPLCAALGGMVVPGAIFFAITATQPTLVAGWAIPTATDIAFALGILALLGPKVPPVLRTFLMALAVIDDLGAIVVIALFYTEHMVVSALIAALIVVACIGALKLCRVTVMWPYLLLGIVLWFFVMQSGVHATIAGVIVGLMIPVGESHSAPATRLMHGLAPWIRWVILPLFAFANAGISLVGITPSTLFSWLPLGVIVGLVVGKPLGVTLAAYLAQRCGVADIPMGIRLTDIAAVGVLCGIGFTMSVFIASLAYPAENPLLLVEAKLGILVGSLISAICGFVLLRRRFLRG